MRKPFPLLPLEQDRSELNQTNSLHVWTLVLGRLRLGRSLARLQRCQQSCQYKLPPLLRSCFSSAKLTLTSVTSDFRSINTSPGPPTPLFLSLRPAQSSSSSLAPARPSSTFLESGRSRDASLDTWVLFLSSLALPILSYRTLMHLSLRFDPFAILQMPVRDAVDAFAFT
jgi:hypothetical protein